MSEESDDSDSSDSSGSSRQKMFTAAGMVLCVIQFAFFVGMILMFMEMDFVEGFKFMLLAYSSAFLYKNMENSGIIRLCSVSYFTFFPNFFFSYFIFFTHFSQLFFSSYSSFSCFVFFILFPQIFFSLYPFSQFFFFTFIFSDFLFFTHFSHVSFLHIPLFHFSFWVFFGCFRNDPPG